jgi:ABC-2 type transport system permease protein
VRHSHEGEALVGSLWDIAAKEVRDSFSSRKFLLLLGLFLLFSFGSVYMGYSDYQQEMEQFRSGGVYGEIPEKPSLMQVFQPLLDMKMSLAAGILAIVLGYNAVSAERENETIEMLLSYPIYRDEVLNGKFVGGMFNLSTALLIALTAASGFAIFLTGVIPSMAQLSRLSLIWLGTVIYMGFFLGLGILFSTLFRSSWRSLAATSFMLLLFLATPFGADIAAEKIYQMPESSPGGPGIPGGAYGGGGVVVREATGSVTIGGPSTGTPGPSEEEMKRRQVMQNREQFQETVSRLSPSTSYTNFVEEMMALNYEGDIQPTMRQSIVSAGGYLVYLVSQTVLIFTFSYLIFMRQDL